MGPGSARLVLCLSDWSNSVCEKAPYLCVSERCCSFLGTLKVRSPMTLFWLLKVQTAGKTPRDWERRMGSSSACRGDVKPAHIQEKVF